VANTKSAIKNVRKNRRRREINRSRQSALRTQIKKLRTLVAARDAEGAIKQLPETIRIIDRSIRKGVLHRNAAARQKSRLTLAVRSLGTSKT
jgi:small subunit ribosomal protein S20